jgi:hypothetical protein
MNKHEPVQYVDLTPHPRDKWQTEHDQHAERSARAVLCAICLGALLWIGIGWLIARFG